MKEKWEASIKWVKLNWAKVEHQVIKFLLTVLAHIVAIMLAAWLLAWLLPGLSHP